MSFALVASATGTASVSAINTTGATLIVVHVGSIGNGASVSDNYGNTYTALTGKAGSQLFYCINPAVGPGHTFTIVSTFPGVSVAAFSGVAPLREMDVGSTATSTAVSPGQIVPTYNGSLIVTGCGPQTGTALSVNGGFSPVIKQYVNGANYAGGLGYLIQTTAAAVSPDWTWTSTISAGATGTVFYLSGAALAAGGGLMSGRGFDGGISG